MKVLVKIVIHYQIINYIHLMFFSIYKDLDCSCIKLFNFYTITNEKAV